MVSCGAQSAGFRIDDIGDDCKQYCSANYTIMTGAWVLLLVLAATAMNADDTDYNVVNEDGSFKFG